MIRYMKRVTQIVVLTAVLVFSGLIVMNSDVMTKSAEAGTHTNFYYHMTKYYCDPGHTTNYYELLDYL